MTDNKEQFLTAEEQANRLVEQLQTLKEEVKNYEEARLSLEGIQQLLSGLVPEIAHSAEETRQVIRELGKIGTPEILMKIQEIQETIVFLGKEFRSSTENIAEKQASTYAILGSRLDGLGRLVWVLMGMGGLILVLLAIVILQVF
jgi:DNA repair ATPase RecN